ncbi:MAG: 16S rRNA processing protein RimM [Clostridia bacterium]|nr:16S rRNA processing protein RimM [Clostridia bacterium]
MKAQYLLIGEIIKPQGIKGELKLRAESEDKTRYSRLKTVYLMENGQYIKRRVLSGRANGDFAYLRLEGITDRDMAEAVRGQLVYVDRSEAISLEDGKYFICDLIGCQATDENGREIGTLTDIQSPNRYTDVYVFATPRGEMMMPAIRSVIRNVDVEAGRIVLDSGVLSEIALWPDSPEVRDDEG